MGTMPNVDGRTWGAYRPLLEEALTDSGRSDTDYDVLGTCAQVLVSPRDGDGIVNVVPDEGTDLGGMMAVSVTVKRFKLPDYVNNPFALVVAYAWLKACDPTINIHQIYRKPGGPMKAEPTPAGWEYHLLKEVEKPDVGDPMQFPGTELPLGETVSLIVSDPPGWGPSALPPRESAPVDEKQA